MTLQIDSRPYRPGSVTRQAIRAAIGGGGIVRLNGYVDELEYDEVVQPFFTGSTIIDAMAKTARPPLRGYLALAPGGEVRPLTGALANLAWLASRDPAQQLDSLAAAEVYAPSADQWTSEYEFRGLQISSFDDIPWSDPDPAERATISELEKRFAGEIRPREASVVGERFRIAFWIVVECRLVYRELMVSSTGAMARTDRVDAEDLPLPVGRFWGMVEGRFVPVG